MQCTFLQFYFRLMPLLSDLSPWRKSIINFRQEVHNWSNFSEALFVADFPGLHLENFISSEFSNISVTVLRGVVVVEQTQDSSLINVTLSAGGK